MNLSLFVLLILTVWCQCPNDCNGHGKCTIDLTCNCYKKGLASSDNSTAGFTGADCSEALCPLGFPFQTYTGSLSTPVTSAPAGGGETPVVIRSMKETAKLSVRHIDEGGDPPVAEDPPAEEGPIFTYEFLIAEKPVFKIEKSKYSCGASSIISCDLTFTDSKKATILSYDDKEMYVKYDGYTAYDVEDESKITTTITSIKALTVQSVSNKKKDMTDYIGITITAIPTDKITWTNYAKILTTMKFNTNANTVDLLCYHPTNNVNGFLYNHTATISKSSVEAEKNNIEIEIKEGNVKGSLAVDDVCFLMSKSNGEILILDSKKLECDVCSQFQLKNNQLLVKAKVHEEINNIDYVTMTIDSTLTRFIINHYNEKKEIELPPKTEDANSKTFYKKLRKQAKLSVSILKMEVNTEKSADDIFIKVENAIIMTYNNETNIITIDKNLNFNNIKARMLEDSDNRYKLKLELKPCEVITPITYGDYKIYKVTKSYSFKGKSSEIICGDYNNITGRVWAIDTTSPTAPITYISYNDSTNVICKDPYNCGDGKIYPLDLECKEIESSIRKDMTNYIPLMADTNGKITLTGFGDIFIALGMKKLPTNTADVRCYNSEQNFGILTKYDKSSLVISGSDIEITITDSNNKPSTGDVCYLMMKFDGSNIDLTKDSCDVCSTFYLDPANSNYYIKDIYLNRIEEDSTNKVVTIGYYKIQSIIDQYYTTSIYPLLTPSDDFYKNKMNLNDILEVSLTLRDKTDSTLLVTDTSSIVNITKTDIKAGEVVNITLSNPMIKLKSIFDNNKNKLDLILTNKIIANHECNSDNTICHHRLLKLDLAAEGGSVIVTKKCSDVKESKISGEVLSYKSSYPQECYIKYSEAIKDDCEYSNYVVTSKRNDLSLYNNAVVEVSSSITTITWTGYGNAVKLMGMNIDQKTFMCKNGNGKLEEKEASIVITKDGDVVFTFTTNDNSPSSGSICYLVYKVDGTDFDFSKSEASKLYQKNGDNWSINTPGEDAVVVEVPTTNTDEKNEIQPVLNIDVGNTLSNTIIEKSKENGGYSSAVLPIPIPKDKPEKVTNIASQVNKININVEVYKNLKLVFQGSALISEVVTSDSDTADLIIVKTTPVLDIYGSKRLRLLQPHTDEYRIIYSFSTALTPVNSLRMLGLGLNKEGGSLYCHNNVQGWDGVVDVIYYNDKPEDEKDNMYFISNYNVVEGDTLACEVRFNRNDLSLYAKSVVGDNNNITWKGYAEGFKKLLEPPNSISTNIPFICYYPKQAKKELTEANGKITDIQNDNNVVFTIEGNTINGYICFPASQSSKLESRLLVNHLDVGDSCSKVEGKWYYGTVDGKPIDIKDKDGNPSVSFDPCTTNDILDKYTNSGELQLPVDTTEEVSSLFSRNINPGMTLEVYSGITFIDSDIISSVRRESGNLIIIKTVNKLALPTHNNEFKTQSPHRLLADYAGEQLRYVVRPNNGILGPIECSGAGKCDRTTGLCQCYEGYTGKICDRIECPNNCNGNGRCVPLSELLSDKDLENYPGYGNNNRVYGCLCDKRHRGFDCSLIECPSGDDPLDPNKVYAEVKKDCSGRGICNYNTGTCECFDGFSGEGCQYMTAAL